MKKRQSQSQITKDVLNLHHEAYMAKDRADLVQTIKRMKTVLIMCKAHISTMPTDDPSTLLTREAVQWGIDVANVSLDNPFRK